MLSERDPRDRRRYRLRLPREIRTLEWRVLSMTEELEAAVPEFVGGLLFSTIERSEDISRLCHFVQNNHFYQNWYRSSVRAITWDGLLSCVEGERLDLEAGATLSDIAVQLFEQRNQTKASRATPLGLHTDDSQFHAAGLLSWRNDVAQRTIATWRRFEESRIWRNHGRRLKAFLAGDAKAMSGRPSLGDFLRIVPFCCHRELSICLDEFSRYAQHLNLTSEQRHVGRLFLCLLHARFSGDDESVIRQLRRLIRELCSGAHEVIRGVLVEIQRSLVEGSSFPAYLRDVQAHGSDLETYGYLGGILSCDTALPAAELPAQFLVEISHHIALMLEWISSFATKGETSDRHKRVARNYFEIERRLNEELWSYRRSLTSPD